jgi:alcohol dehydrogenase
MPTFNDPPIIGPSPDLRHLPGSRIRVLFNPGGLARVGPVARAEGARRALLVTDPGIVDAGHVETAMRSLYRAGIVTRLYDGVGENPTTTHVHRGLAMAQKFDVDFIIGLGGGSSMDCAKGINFLLTNGGRMADYWGVNKAAKPLLPLIAVPTTSGTGSEAQSAALITDPDTHAKMACWDEKAAARIAILDPDLTATQPRKVAAATGIDAISHAVETAGCTKRNDVSLRFSRAAWDLLSRSFEASLEGEGSGFMVQGSANANAQSPGAGAPSSSLNPEPRTLNPSSEPRTLNPDPRADMLLGAHLAGCAIENSMLGAAHACANPLTASFGVVHGHAVGMMLPHVVRYNSANGHYPYASLGLNAHELAALLDRFLQVAGLPRRFADCGADPAQIPALAESAAKQWTATFNPRAVGAAELAAVYAMAAA